MAEHTSELTVSGSRGHLCKGCGLAIRERYLLLVQDQAWHGSCLRCCKCDESLAGEERCFSKDGCLYCQQDYLRLFGESGQCCCCSEVIVGGENCIRTSRGYLHMRCLYCTTCNQWLEPRHQFYMQGPGQIVCCTCQSHAPLSTPSAKTGSFSRNGVCGVENISSRPQTRFPRSTTLSH